MMFSKVSLPPNALPKSVDMPGTRLRLQTQYTWTAADGSLCIRFHFRVIRGLTTQRATAMADREVENCGVLLGSVADALTPVVVVEAFEPAGHDETLQLVLDRWRRSPERRIHAVGSYRLAVPGALEPGAPRWSDGTLSYPRVDVAIEGPVPDGLAASISWCASAGDLPQRDRLVFPESSLLPSGALSSAASGASAVHITADSDHVADAGQAADRTPSRNSRGFVIGGVAVLAIAAAIAAKVNGVRPVPTRTGLSAPTDTETSMLGLSVQRAGESLIVKWDPEVMTNSRGGILTIRVRDSRRDWVLDREQLRAGRVLYSVDSDDITFRLEVFDDLKRSRLETLRVLSKPNGESVPAHGVYTQPPPEGPQAATAPVKSKPFLVPPSSLAKNAPVPTPPEADLPPTTLFVTPAPTVQLPSPQISPEQIPPARPPELPISSVAEPLPKSGADTATSVTPPVPVNRFAPTLPSNLRALIQTRVKVTISVTVDASGKVTEAEGSVEAPNSPGALGEFIKRAAVDAARQWRFEPARVNGRAVKGTCVIHFEVGPATTRSETRIQR
ncbi:MAG: hypothetical protein JWP63_465 [Candidatus Solibacter sp.]|nr:hypothetical protein [Candidatus Solibacter sp.]